MTIKVNPEGALIPKELLGGAEEIKVLARHGTRLVIQVGPEPRRDEGTGEGRSIYEVLGNDPIDVPEAKDDPIWRWGEDPVDGCEPDASENIDRYRFGAGS